MRSLATVLAALAIVLWLAGTAPADWIAYADLNNLQNANPGVAPGDPTGAGNVPLSTPTATTGGVMWIDTGSGPVWLEQDVNMEFLACETRDGTYTDLLSMGDSRPAGTPALFLLSKPAGDPQSAIGWNIIASWGPAGGPGDNNPNGTDGYQGIFADPIGDNYYISPGITESGYYFVKIRAWTGNFNSYSAAVAGGAYVAESAIFHTHFAAGIDPNVGDIGPMPAMVLKHLLPGDANGDHAVNINDLSRVLTNYDKAGVTWGDGDFNGDGKVDINDLSVVLTNYDRRLGSSAAGIAALPEPSTALLAAAILPVAACAIWRRRAVNDSRRLDTEERM